MEKRDSIDQIDQKVSSDLDNGPSTFDCEGVFLVKMKNAFVPVKRDNTVNTYSRFSTV